MLPVVKSGVNPSLQRITAWLLLVLTLVLGLAGGWLALAEPTTTRLPDGSRLYVAGVTWGKSHRIVAGSWWQRTLLHLWPGASGIGGRTASITTEKDELVVWIRKRAGPVLAGGSYVSGGPGTFWSARDEHGCSFFHGLPVEFPDPPRRSLFPSVRPSAPRMVGADGLLAASMRVFPRRTGTFDLVLVPGRNWEPAPDAPEIARLPVAIPPAAVNRTPTGTPEPYPIRRTIGDSTFVVTGMGLVRPVWAGSTDSSESPSPHERAWKVPELRFHTEKQGRATQDWRPLQVTVSDGSGNQRSSGPSSETDPEGRMELEGLCRYEPAWKFDVELVRRWDTRAIPDGSRRLRIPIPPPGKRRALDQRFRIHGVDFHLVAAAGAGKQSWPDGLTQESDRPMLRMRVLPSNRTSLFTWRVLAGASPIDRRSPMKQPLQGAFLLKAGESSHDQSFALPLSSGARWVEMEFGIHASRKIAFLAAPPH